MKTVSFLIEVTMPGAEINATATVRILVRDGSASPLVTAAAQMLATEHMMTAFAASSDAGFERALELLCDGARSNRIRVLGGIPVQ